MTAAIYDSPSVVQVYLESFEPGPLLTAEQERDLSARIRTGDVAAREKLTTSNLALVVSIAKRYAGLGLDMGDLIQEGNAGLWKATTLYDGRLGFRFSTYATHWIRQHVRRALDSQGKAIRLPVYQHDRLKRIQRTRTALIQALGRYPTDEEIQRASGLTETEYQSTQEVPADPLSYDEPVENTEGEEVSTFLDFVCDQGESVEATAEFDELRGLLTQALGTLTERERWVIERRYGLIGDRDHTLEELGREMGVSRERIRQIEAKALRHLRQGRVVRRLKAWA